MDEDKPEVVISEDDEKKEESQSTQEIDTSELIPQKRSYWKYHAFVFFLIITIPLFISLLQTTCLFIYTGWKNAVFGNLLISFVFVIYLIGYFIYLIISSIYNKNMRFKMFCDTVLNFCKCCPK